MPANPVFRWQRLENNEFQASLGNIRTVFLSPRETKKESFNPESYNVWEMELEYLRILLLSTIQYNTPPIQTVIFISFKGYHPSTGMSRPQEKNPLHRKSMCLGPYSKKTAPFCFGDQKVPFQS